MSRQRRLHGDVRGFGVADFSHHDHLRVVAQQGPERVGERNSLDGVDLGLRDAGQDLFDRLLE